MGIMLEKLKIPLKYATYLFNWDEPGIKYPPDLRKVVKKLPPATHLAVKAQIENKWVLLDATWDIPLKRAGFPVNEIWDGSSDTRNAVKPIKEVLHNSVEERLAYTAELRKSWTDEQAKTHKAFPPLFNAWLEKIRK